ncbi:MAG: peptidase dimerization domain-containing protein, partial [Bowdeniella nasicola]|nr:peptidase dimerization domain-containing protein [Bowdeniella nasicola]
NTLMCRLLATLHDDNGDVAVQGLHHAQPSQLEYPEAQWRSEAGVIDSYELAGTGTLPSRLWAKPAINIIGMDITSVEHKSNTITPTCRAAISMRIPAGQNPRAAAEALQAHLHANAPFGAQVDVQINELGEPFAGDTDGEAGEVAHWALAEAFGTQAVDIGLGASIPFIAVLEEQFPQAAILVTGVEDPDTRAHSANESLHIADFKNVVLAEALMLARWGKTLAR